jgi:hypothetical protein
MRESIRQVLAREAAEAEARAEAEERGEVEPTRGQRGRKRAADPSQVYSVRIPVSRLRKLRELAERSGTQPTALIREWVIERLDEQDTADHENGSQEKSGAPEQAVRSELKLGPSRVHGSHDPRSGKVRLHA